MAATSKALDRPETTLSRRRVLGEKKFLRQIYETWYDQLTKSLPAIPGRVLEVGSGAGFLDQRIPDLITSEILFVPPLSVVLDGCHLPLQDGCLRAIVMTDVLHHIPYPRQFFREAARCVRPGGVIAMVEPWRTTWSELIYRHLHHEPFEPGVREWEFEALGPLSSANGALPWIMFERDRRIFQSEFPEWSLTRIQPAMPLLYLLSGGLSPFTFQPGFLYPFWERTENIFSPWMHRWAMFAYIVLTRQ